MPAPADYFMHPRAVEDEAALSRTTIWRLIRTGDFPAPRKIGKRRIAWLASDVARWRESRPNTTASKMLTSDDTRVAAHTYLDALPDKAA